MKTIKKLLSPGLLACMAVGLMLTTSCIKKANDYAPVKPIQPVNGFYSSADVDPDNLVAYWPFNGTLKDSLSNTTGTATGTSFAGGVKGQGLQGADNGYVVSNVPSAIQNLQSFTVSLWAYMTPNANAVELLGIANSQNDGSGFWGSLDIYTNGGLTAASGDLVVHAFNVSGSPSGADAWLTNNTITNPCNTWINIAVTFDAPSSTFVIYYNGKVLATDVVAGWGPINWTGAQQMVFGTFPFQTVPSLTSDNPGQQSWASSFNGVLDQVRFYNKVLDLNDIGAIYGLEKLGR